MMRMAPPEENADPTADPWAEFIRVTAPEFRKPTIEQIETVTKPIWEALVAGEQYSHGRDDGHLGRRPARTWSCTDNVTGYPAVELAGAPWVRFVSANPLEMRDADLPPVLSAGSRSTIGASGRRSRSEYHRQHEDAVAPNTTTSGHRWRGAVPVGRVQHQLALVQPLPVPRGGRLSACRSPRPHLASAELDGADHRAAFDVDAICPGTARSCTCRSARSGAWTSD